MIPADRFAPVERRWIVWDEGKGRGQSAHVALCTTDGRCAWEIARPDAYSPTITFVGSWSHDPVSAFLVTYQYGAGAEEIAVIDLEPDRQPRLIKELLVTIAALDANDVLELEGGDTPGGKLCLSAAAPSFALRTVGCPAPGSPR